MADAVCSAFSLGVPYSWYINVIFLDDKYTLNTQLIPSTHSVNNLKKNVPN